MKITRVIQEAITEEVEITFPFYRKQQSLFYYYGIDERTVICVVASEHNHVLDIKKEHLCVPNVFHPDSHEITKEEFEAKFEEAMQHLINYKNQ